MEFQSDGAELFPAAFTAAQVGLLEIALAPVQLGRPGTRLRPMVGLAKAIRPATLIAASILGSEARPVRATLFDKSMERNWSLGWHQTER
jgi:hypothetical protein